MIDIPEYAGSFQLPPVPCRDDGRPRRVGFELEFSGLSLEQTAAAILDALGGEPQSESVAERVLTVERLGEFRIELDWEYLKRKAAENAEQQGDGDWLDYLSQVASLLVPVEVVCPPIPVTELEALQPMVAALREAGAVGTAESLWAAYGVHVNVEIPRLDAPTLFGYLRAFALLQWWLVEIHEVDVTRRVSPYIDLYPEAYLQQVLSRRGASMDEIFDDYLQHNPTRNRAMDLLPMLAEVDEDRVRRAVPDPRIKARPTFHYRLPNCHIERPDWSLAGFWNTWCVVERLAGQPAALDELAEAFLEAHRPLFGVNRRTWIDYMDRWLRDHGLV